jgi:hypothetical protein
MDSGFKPVNQSSWGGSIIRDENGRVHMFAALMTENCGLTSWATNSEIVHATADTPLGPFTTKSGNPVRRVGITAVPLRMLLSDT